MAKKKVITVEEVNGVHSKEKTQTTKGKTAAEKYAEHSKIDYSMCDSDTWEDRTGKKVKILEG